MKPKDKTGKDRIVRNLSASWMGQIVVIISGFVIPRQIDASLGATSLGIWDFGWSTVNYFRLFGFGLAGGLNRFVALYNAEEAEQKLRRAVSSTVFMTIIISIVVAGSAAVLASFLPVVFDNIPPEEVDDSQVLIILFGATVAYRMLCWPSRSILTGNHLTTVTSMVTATGDLLTLVGLFSVLKLGGGIAELGIVVLCTTLFSETTRVFMARRVYDGPILERASLDLKMMGKMFAYGMKNNVSGLPTMIVVQTTSLVLAATAGPAALAVFSRPLALCNLIGRLVRQYAILLTPVAGGMQGLKRDGDLKDFYLTSMRSSIAMTLPPLLLLGAYGDIVIRLWMHDDYVVPWLCPLLSAAFFMSISQSAAMRILAGLNAHGRIAVRSLIITTVVFGIALAVAVITGLDVIAAAIVVGLGMSVGPGSTVMVGACKKFDVRLLEYFRHAVLPPFLCNIPLLIVVLVSRSVDPDMSFLNAVVWGIFGGVVVLMVYWRIILSDEVRVVLSKGFKKLTRS